MDIARIINGYFSCPDCHATGSWVRQGKRSVRLNSTIYRLRCTRCETKVVAKVANTSRGSHEQIREEYEVLRDLQLTFTQDPGYGTLEPLAYRAGDGSEMLITRFSRGMDLITYMRGQRSAALQNTCCRAGVWLRKLHECGQHGGRTIAPHSHKKLDYLADTYGPALRRNRKIHALFDQLRERAADVDAYPLHMVRNHGDFKPANILCDGAKYVGLDIHLNSTGPAVYDLAPFLNHLWLAGHVMGASSLRRCYRLCEAAFLRGYGGIQEHELCVLRWAQIYFVLCYLGAYTTRGLLPTIYARQKVWPLGQWLAAELPEKARPTICGANANTGGERTP